MIRGSICKYLRIYDFVCSCSLSTFVPQGIKKVKSQALTVPESPAFALKNRKRAVFEHKEEMEEECKMLKAKPPVHVGIPFQPQLEHKVTVPAPFSFDSKIEATRQKKEALIHSVLEEEQKVGVILDFGIVFIVTYST